MANNKTSIIVGMGEVGRAMFDIVDGAGKFVCSHDKNKDYLYTLDGRYDFMHICFPWSKNFLKEVRKYQKKWKPRITIIHSTVPIGTCEKLDAWHAPIRGSHPDLVDGIKTFVMFLGGKANRGEINEITEHFKRLGIRLVYGGTARNTEAMKLWDTTQLGWFVLLEKEIWDFCKKNNLDFSVVYTMANATYNQGYRKLGKFWVVRPFLKHLKGKIGGHCTIPNCRMLNSYIAKTILKMNKTF